MMMALMLSLSSRSPMLSISFTSNLVLELPHHADVARLAPVLAVGLSQLFYFS
jgi:hypothetical protein